MTAIDRATAARYRTRFSLRRRHSPVLVYLASTALLAVFLVPVGFIPSSSTVLGIPGSGVSLIAILAAILAGPLVGVLVALTAGVLFYVCIADLGAIGEPVGTLGGLFIWVLAALVAGYLADTMRTRTRQRDAEKERAGLYEALESGLLPHLPLAHPLVSVTSRYVPSEQRLHLGGDFLDLVELESGDLAFVLGDVSGHGPEAAAFGATLRATWRALMVTGVEPGSLIGTMNSIVAERAQPEPMFVTACLAWLNMRAGALSYVSLGHPPMVLLDASGEQLSAYAETCRFLYDETCRSG